jgi:hypothetical protein
VIQQIPPKAFHPALRDAVLPGTFERSSHRLHPQASNSYGNLDSILPVPVEDQKSGSRSERKRFPQLLNGPQAGRVLGHVEVQNPPPVVADDEEAVEHTERDRGHGKEVHGRNRFPVVSKE